MSVFERSYLEREGSEFAEYTGFAVEYRDSSHRYWIHTYDGPGKRTAAVSVTSALKVLDKPALVGWAEKMGAEGALRLERQGELASVPVEEAIHLVRMHKMGADAKRDAGADRGTAIHEALRLYCAEGTIPKVGEFDPQVRGYVSGLCKWLVSASPEPVSTEQIVGSVEHGFAGRFDLLAMVEGRRTLVDLKTSARVYPEHHLQIAAYILALAECGDSDVDRGLIVAVGEGGEFHAAECCSGPAEFLSVLACNRAIVRVRAAVKAQEKAAAA